MKLKIFFCQFPNPWALRVSGMGGYTSKCEKSQNHCTLLCTYDLFGPVCNAFAFNAASIHYEGKCEGIGPWTSRVFWALWNDIEPIGECHLGPKQLEVITTCHGNFYWVSIRCLMTKVRLTLSLCSVACWRVLHLPRDWSAARRRHPLQVSPGPHGPEQTHLGYQVGLTVI